MLRRRQSLLLLALVVALSYAQDANFLPNETELKQNIEREAFLTTKAVEATTISQIHSEDIESTSLKPEENKNGVSFIASDKRPIEEKQQNSVSLMEANTNKSKIPNQNNLKGAEKQQTQQEDSNMKTQTGRFKGGTLNLVVNKPATRYPPDYYTTPYPPTRPAYPYPPYPYPPYPYPPYPTQAPTTSRPNWPPFWPPYGGVGGFPGGGFPGGGFPGYGFGYGYPGYGYPWYHHHHHHWNNTDDGGRAATIDIVSTNLERIDEETEMEKKPAIQSVKSTVPFFSFLNFNRSKK